MRSRLVGLGFGGFLALSACNGQSIGGIDADSGPGVDSSAGPQVDASADGSADATPDGRFEPQGLCCPIDPTQSGCMRLGGTNTEDGATCVVTCDFFCSTNWRIEKDVNDCDTWRYDMREPAPGEGPQCQPLDGGAPVDGGPNACGTSTCNPATEFCYGDVNGSDKVTYACGPRPASCASDNTCACIQAANGASCQAVGGLITCLKEGDMVHANCEH